MGLFLFINPEWLGGPRGAAWHILSGLDRRVEAGPSEPLPKVVKLRQEIDALRKALLARDEALLLAGERLRVLEQFREAFPEARVWPRVPARVICYTERSGLRRLHLSRGLRDGVRRGMPVIRGKVLVGTVIETHLSDCVVALLTDPESRLRTFLRADSREAREKKEQTGRHVGVAVGTSTGIELRMVKIKQAPARGDLVFSSGLDGKTPTGLLIGRVARVVSLPHLYQARVEVEPAVDLTQLDQLHILQRDPLSYAERQTLRNQQRRKAKKPVATPQVAAPRGQ